MKYTLELRKKRPIEQPFIPRAFKLMIEKQDYEGGYKLLVEGARAYFLRFQRALNPFPTDDAALLIHLYRHMADGLEQNDPKAAAMAAELKKYLKLPPIEFDRQPK